MRAVPIGFLALSMLLSACVTNGEPSLQQAAVPDATSIERVLRDKLADDAGRPGLNPYEKAVLKEFRLVELEQVSSTRWYAQTELLFDYGPAPASVIGFERTRRGYFELRLDRQDAQLRLTRFTPVGTVQPLLTGT